MLKKLSVQGSSELFRGAGEDIKFSSLRKPACRHTGAFPELGLMTTLGAMPCPDLVGVPGAPEPP